MGERSARVLDALHDLRAIPTRRSLLPPPATGAADPRWQASWKHLHEVYAHAMERYVAAILRATRGADPQDAPDIVQAYLGACLEKGWLEHHDGDLRCFRAWLKVQLQRFTRGWLRERGAAKRGGSVARDDAALAVVGVEGPDLDAALDAGWVDAAVVRAIARLREGNEEYAEIVADLLRTDGEGSSDLAVRLGRPPKDLAILRHRARRRFAALFVDEVRASVRDPEAYEALLARLEPHLP